MVDEQTRRSVETMCLCGLDVEGLKGCFPKIEEGILIETCPPIGIPSFQSITIGPVNAPPFAL